MVGYFFNSSADAVLTVVPLQPVEQLAQHARPASTFLAQTPCPAADGLVLVSAGGRIGQLIEADGDVPGTLTVRCKEDGHQHPERCQDAASHPDDQEYQQQRAAFHGYQTIA